MDSQRLLHLYRTHRKSIVAAVALVASLAYTAVTDGVITSDEWKTIGLEAVTAFLVYLLPNTDESLAETTGTEWVDTR